MDWNGCYPFNAYSNEIEFIEWWVVSIFGCCCRVLREQHVPQYTVLKVCIFGAYAHTYPGMLCLLAEYSNGGIWWKAFSTCWQTGNGNYVVYSLFIAVHKATRKYVIHIVYMIRDILFCALLLLLHKFCSNILSWIASAVNEGVASQQRATDAMHVAILNFRLWQRQQREDLLLEGTI